MLGRYRGLGSARELSISGSGHVAVGVGVLLVALEVLPGDEVLDALLDEADVRLEHLLQLVHHLHHQLRTQTQASPSLCCIA